MSPFRSRSDFVARALEQFVHAARQVAEWPDLLFERSLDRDIQQPGALDDGSGSAQLRQCHAFVFLTAALLPLHQQPVPTFTKAFGSAPSIRLLFLPPSRGPPSSGQQPASEATTG